MIEEYKKNGYVIFDDLLPEKEYKKILDICKSSSYIKISQKRADRYALWSTPNDKFFPDSDEVYQNQFWGTDDVVQTPEVKQMFDKYIKPKVLELTNNQAGKFMHQTNMYRNNGKDFLRIHYDDYMGLCGYVFYVGEYQWKYDWGGLLQMRVGDDVKTILPNKNRLVLMNHSLRMGHWVTPTNTWAKENRYTIVGFCIDKDRDLPETWTKRKDQRVEK
jgi:Rps23 Pro-64 3,4-dihydroxylase Tpa1-like proline 4-hydroxylase